MRFILNLKNLNKFMDPPHFKIEDMKTALKMLSRDCFMTKIDLKDAYFLIPIREKDRKFLRFCFNGTLFEFNALPFGLCTGPWEYTKINKPVVHFLRAKGHKSVVYLDDFLLFGRNAEEYTRNTN